MTRQEIRKGIEEYTERPAALWAYLHSQCLLLKKEEECSYCKGTGFADFQINDSSAVCPMCRGTKTYALTEPLIEGEEIREGQIMVTRTEILELCKRSGVGFSLTYAESDDSWWGSINSPAQSEETVTKNSSYEGVLLRLKEHLEQLVEESST